MTFHSEVGLIQSIEDLRRRKTDLPQEEKILLTLCLQTQVATLTLPWISGLLACPADFKFASPHNFIRQFLSLSIYVHTLNSFYFSGKP